jgi:phosphoribosyl-ATP pyrophosphohydrolase/phosphoribosyl-AMP cyclohydrolase
VKISNVQELAALNFAKADGLVPAVVQHHVTGEVLMLGYADAEALRRCLDTGELWLYSRSRQQYWRKGETSGNTQRVVDMHADCDRDAVLIRVDPSGPACHTGARSCFTAPPVLAALGDVIAQRAASGAGTSYTVRLLRDENLRLKKLGEEAVELALACQSHDQDRSAEEAADLIYHTLVACAAAGASVDDILQRLAVRARPDPS